MSSAITGKYSLAFRRRGGLRGLLRTYGFLQLLDAGLREAWESIGMRILHFLGRGPATGYGWLEALLSPTSDYWLRYAKVIEALEQVEAGKAGRVIEVSSGGWGGIAWALPRREQDICLVDWSADLLGDRRGGKAWRVCADGCRLPFADNSFDTAISLDTVEHLPRSVRAVFLDELKRVTRRTLLVTCPLQSSDGTFQAQALDLRLSREIARRGDVLPGWLQEHIEQGHPQREEMLALLPGAEITGLENCEAWWRFAALSRKKFLWVFAPLFYPFAQQKNDREPPYRRGLLHWQKPENVNEESLASDLVPDPGANAEPAREAVL